jgi:hypothetical protein
MTAPEPEPRSTDLLASGATGPATDSRGQRWWPNAVQTFPVVLFGMSRRSDWVGNLMAHSPLHQADRHDFPGTSIAVRRA